MGREGVDMSSSTRDFLWESLDIYEYGYTKQLKQNKLLQQKFIHIRSYVIQLELNNFFLSKENQLLKDKNEVLQRKNEDQEEHLNNLQSQVDRKGLSQSTSGDDFVSSDYNRINYFADAIEYQRKCYNDLKGSFDSLKKENEHNEIAKNSANEEIYLLKAEVEQLKEELSSLSTEAEQILTSSFLDEYRARFVDGADICKDTSQICTSENLVENLSLQQPFDLLRHRILNLDGRSFEKFSCRMFECLGYKVVHRGGSCDLGIDFTLKEKDYTKTWTGVGQCKRYNRKIGSQDIREFIGSMLSYGCHTGFYITTSCFTRDAEQARIKAKEKSINIDFWDYDTICNIIKRKGIDEMLLESLDCTAQNDEIEIKGTNKNRNVDNLSFRTPQICFSKSPSLDENDSPCYLDFDSELEFDDDKENLEYSSDVSDLVNSLSHCHVATSLTSTTPLSTPQKHSEVKLSGSSNKLVNPVCAGTPPVNKFRFDCSSVGISSSTKKKSKASSRIIEGCTPMRDGEAWLPAEVDALAQLVPMFRDEKSGNIAWGKMEQWLRENEERGMSNNGKQCALKPVHFDKEKLRSRWKNDCRKLKINQ